MGCWRAAHLFSPLAYEQATCRHSPEVLPTARTVDGGSAWSPAHQSLVPWHQPHQRDQGSAVRRRKPPSQTPWERVPCSFQTARQGGCHCPLIPRGEVRLKDVRWAGVASISWLMEQPGAPCPPELELLPRHFCPTWEARCPLAVAHNGPQDIPHCQSHTWVPRATSQSLPASDPLAWLPSPGASVSVPHQSEQMAVCLL